MSHDPVKPYQADHRIMKKILNQISKASESFPSELSLVAEVFLKAGGSWERVFKGSVKDLVLLRECLKTAVDKGKITSKPNWDKR